MTELEYKKIRRRWASEILAALVLFLVLLVVSTKAQNATPPDAPGDAQKVCISQEAADKCVKCAQELTAARDVIAKFQTERSASEAERAAAQALIKGLNDLVAVKDRIAAEKDKVIALYENVVAMYQRIIDGLEKQINKPKSGWQKFLSALKTIGYILAGAALGRGL